MGHRSQGNEWRTVSGPHALVFLEANQPRQSLVDPGINHGFEPDYGLETGRRARRRPAPEGSQGRGARPRMRWGVGRKGSPGPRAHQRARYVLRCARPSRPRPYCSKATILGSLEPRELAVDRLGLTNNPRIKHCRASHLAACGHTVLPKIGPVIALRRRTDYQSPNWLSGAEDELSQPRFR